MKLLTKIFIITLALGSGKLLYDRLPLTYKYEVEDWYARLGEPAFIAPPDSFTRREQTDLIREYKNRGHKLKCYGNLQVEERINNNNDYLCSADINTAYDNIPARLVTFFFSKGELTDVRIEFPSTSFNKLQNYLSRKLEGRPRLDQLPQFNFGRDNLGSKLMVWGVDDGVIVTSNTEVPGQPEILLWSSRKSLGK